MTMTSEDMALAAKSLNQTAIFDGYSDAERASLRRVAKWLIEEALHRAELEKYKDPTLADKTAAWIATVRRQIEETGTDAEEAEKMANRLREQAEALARQDPGKLAELIDKWPSSDQLAAALKLGEEIEIKLGNGEVISS